MNISIVTETSQLSFDGKLIFPDVVRRLMGAGVEWYIVDYIRNETTYYGPGHKSHRITHSGDLWEVAPVFSSGGIKAAIRAAQADEVRYPEFSRRATAAGCAVYSAFLLGRKVVYTGRHGDSHTELFPTPA